jgi:hypothetical protein
MRKIEDYQRGYLERIEIGRLTNPKTPFLIKSRMEERAREDKNETEVITLISTIQF